MGTVFTGTGGDGVQFLSPCRPLGDNLPHASIEAAELLYSSLTAEIMSKNTQNIL